MKNSIDTTGNRAGCNAVPQATGPPRVHLKRVQDARSERAPCYSNFMRAFPNLMEVFKLVLRVS